MDASATLVLCVVSILCAVIQGCGMYPAVRRLARRIHHARYIPIYSPETTMHTRLRSPYNIFSLYGAWEQPTAILFLCLDMQGSASSIAIPLVPEYKANCGPTRSDGLTDGTERVGSS